jgi:protein-disulfide isomerase
MTKNTKKIIIISSAVIAIIAFGFIIFNNYKTKTSFKYANQNASETKPEQHSQDAVNAKINEDAQINEARKNSDLLKILPNDLVIGDKNAPVLMIEYASLSCPHCASFVRESFDKLKAEYIDSGKVKFVYRDFPLNQQALNAAMFAFCNAKDGKEISSEKYYATVKALFKSQDSWAFEAKFIEKLAAIAQLEGMSAEKFQSCVNSKSLQDQILNHRMLVTKNLFLKSTPSFFVNGEISEGYIDYLTLKKLIDKKLSSK